MFHKTRKRWFVPTGVHVLAYNGRISGCGLNFFAHAARTYPIASTYPVCFQHSCYCSTIVIFRNFMPTQMQARPIVILHNDYMYLRNSRLQLNQLSAHWDSLTLADVSEVQATRNSAGLCTPHQVVLNWLSFKKFSTDGDQLLYI